VLAFSCERQQQQAGCQQVARGCAEAHRMMLSADTPRPVSKLGNSRPDRRSSGCNAGNAGLGIVAQLAILDSPFQHPML
jgi:hypothetical protein